MKMMERINQIWAELELNSSTVAGLFKLRFSDVSKCDVFLGVKHPEAHRLLILKVPFNIGKEFNFKFEFRGLKFEKIYDPDDSKFLLLNLVLVEKHFKDVFDTLVADIVTGLLNENDIRVILRNYSNRLIKWQSLFERFSQEGLIPEQQRGLFGELYFLRKYLQAYTNHLDILNTWIGTERQVRDFQSGTWAVEVKTTYGSNHQKVNISSERQLDITNLNDLFLYHISLEQMQNSGETLNDIVDSMLGILEGDTMALNKFKSKIYEVGYFDLQRSLYDGKGYFIREDVFYKVENDFPRIQENDIRAGVGDVKYSIIISQCTHFIIDENVVLNTAKP